MLKFNRSCAISLFAVVAFGFFQARAQAFDSAAAEVKLNELTTHFSEIDLASNASHAPVDFFKAAGEDGYAFLHHAYSGRADGAHQKAALYLIFQAFPEHKHMYLNEPVRTAYGDDYGYSYCNLKPFLVKLSAYSAQKTPPQPSVAKATVLEAEISSRAKEGATGLAFVKGMLDTAVEKDKAGAKPDEAHALLEILEAIRTHGNASLLDAGARFLNDPRPTVAGTALNIFQAHAANLGAKLGSNQECFVWWAVEGKQRVELK